SGGLIGKRGIKRWISWFKLPVGISQSLCFLIRHKPDLVVGIGGYVSGPVVASAWTLRIPILIHEQNTIPGITNKLLGRIANKIAVSFKQSKLFFPQHKVVETGNMIREEFCELNPEKHKDPNGKFNILVFGGSQGAHSINMAVKDALDLLEADKSRLFFMHQTGKQDVESMKKYYAAKGFSADVRPFFHDMAEQYRKASLIICRAGATTLAEVTATGKVSILIPFPFAAHNHQEKNARILEEENAAEMILNNQLTGETLAQSIRHGLEDPQRLKQMQQNSFKLGNRNATEKVKQLCLQLLKETNQMTTIS
ncbi:MAG: undecaprenyldiphospho-muramoylpentapeptide beta-N-acetylglucosaminyltransferase, partial [Nitrospinota bacterium]|nr:undecaprenyldiphospho-muramoylpentapeptide beta-N-acetylglucosaminyltransferase [Nitrospinota bacterium]